MKTLDDILKMKATVLYLLQECGGSLDYIKMYKLLYFSQQLHLVRYGRGIFRDSFYARKRGPVPGLIYGAVKQVEHDEIADGNLTVFTKAISVSNDSGSKSVKALEAPDMDELSISDIECITEVVREYAHIDSMELSELSHDKAWQAAYRRYEKDPEQNKLSLIEIARSGGASDAMLKYIKYQIKLDQALLR